MKKLLLLTKHFPYDDGESFIANELETLKSSFDSVTIIATAVSSQTAQRLSTQSGIGVLSIAETQALSLRYFKYILRSFCYSGNQMLRDELQKTKSVKGKLGVCYAFSRARKNAQDAYRLLQRSISRGDHVDLYSYWFGDLALTALFLKEKLRMSSVCVFSRAHGYDVYPERNRSGVLPFTEHLLAQLDHVFPCSNHGMRYLSSRYPKHARKITTSYLGTWDHGAACNAIDETSFRIVTCSGLTPVKQVGLLAKALKLLVDNGAKGLAWTCIGDGPQLAGIRSYAAQYLREVKTDFTGRLSNENVLRLYQKKTFHVFLNVSESEGLPVSIMEAMSFGIPAVATNVGGTGEIVRTGQTGILLSANPDAEEIAVAIQSIKGMSAEAYAKLRVSARRYWAEHFDAERNYNRFVLDVRRLYPRT